ncbi:capsule biosynthesis protein [Alteromonas pelagimontana]|uniref:Capsule biosynthesis protein n=1 Tax=Alteromonas pelagimontana TaxID=1858656 RepID=A0A6M4MFJ2_9ALTE|nr:capsule biosynthesis protein [Alteromonas pelagimontana]QJR81747.1 capsule biosynthesis protein [Alteromonas pelagimontana]
MQEQFQKYIKTVKKNSLILVIFPWVVYALYLVFIASPQYESQSKLIIKSTDGGSSFDPSMLLSTVSVATSATDSQLVEAFILSSDMLHYLDRELNLSEHYRSEKADIFSRLTHAFSEEELMDYYLNHIEVSVDSASSIITLTTRGFTPEIANNINKAIVRHAESFINEISNNLAKSKLRFAQGEHDIVENKLQKSKTQILEFQSKHNVLDPTAEGAAFQQIGFSLQATLAQKQAELNTLTTMMSDIAPEVQNAKRQIKALQKQINEQKKKISGPDDLDSQISVSELMAQYSNLQVQLQLAIQAYSSSLITLESARVEAYQQLQHLVTIEKPTFPEENKYPRIVYNLTLFAVILFVLYGTIRIIVATIKEL